MDSRGRWNTVARWGGGALLGACLTAGAALSGEDCINPLAGDGEDNTLIGTDCDQSIRGYAGNDLIRGAGGNDIIQGGAGEDEIYGDSGDDIIDAGTDDDRVEGGSGSDRLTGFGGDDRLLGNSGDDLLRGGSDDDYLDGGPGVDTLQGDSGDDYLDDPEGANTLDGGTNQDTVVGRTGSGVLRGGSGDDFLIVVGNTTAGYELVEGDARQTNGGSDLLFFARDANPDMVYEQAGELLLRFDLRTQDAVQIDLGNVVHVEAVATGDGDDQVIGTDWTASFSYTRRLGGLFVHELFFTAAGDDAIHTGEGDDFVDAGAGDDTITLGTGACYLIGGEGNDTYIWSEAALVGNKVTRLTDLEPGDVVRWQGSWQPADITLDAIQDDGGAATAVRLSGVRKLLLKGVEPGDVRLRQARDGIWIDVLRSLPRRPSLPKGAAPLLGG